MWRGLGKEGMEDAIQSGLFRAKQNVIPEYYPGSKLQLNKSFGENPYFTPKFNTAATYGDDFIAEVPVSAANWRNRYGRGKTWSQVADRQIPIEQGRILQKDWLRGYKQGPKGKFISSQPVITRGVINYFDESEFAARNPNFNPEAYVNTVNKFGKTSGDISPIETPYLDEFKKGGTYNASGRYTVADKLRGLKKGGPIIDPRGQWAHPGKDTIIPTEDGRITMQGVPYSVYGEDETGYGQMMYPGGEYDFPGQMVYEKPMMRNGGLINKNNFLPKYQMAGSTKAPLNAKDFQNWNNLIKYAQAKKIQPEVLDANDKVGYGIIDEYNQVNPDQTFDRNKVRDIQQLMLDYRNKSIERMKSVPKWAAGDIYEKFGEDFSGFMPNLSGADNFPGSKTLNWSVPKEYIHDVNTSTTDVLGFAPITRGVVSRRYGGGTAKMQQCGMVIPKAQDGRTIRAANAEFSCEAFPRGKENSAGVTTGNATGFSNAPVTWNELIRYNETNPKDKVFKNRLKELQSQFPGLTSEQLLAAQGDSARIKQRMSNLPRYDKPAEQTYDKAYHQFYRTMMDQLTPVTTPQILQFHSQKPGGLSGFQQTVQGNYGRPKLKNGGWLDAYDIPKAQVGLETGCPQGYFKDSSGNCVPFSSMFGNQQRVTSESSRIPQRDYDLESKVRVRNAIANQPQLNQGRTLTALEEADRTRRNKLYVQKTPNAQLSESGEITQKNRDRSLEGKPLTALGRKQDASLERAMNSLDAAGYITGVGALVSSGLKSVRPVINKAITKLDQKVYPTRVYRAEVPGGNTTGYSSTGIEAELANKVFKKGDFATKDLSESFQYLRGSESSLGKPGLISGQDMNFTEYKVPFWKKNVSFDKDVTELKKIQGTDVNANEYIIPNNKILYPRKTTTIKAVPEDIKNTETLLPSGVTTRFYNPGSIPLSTKSTEFASPAYKYIEDQMNAVTGHRMPLTYNFDQTLGYKQNVPMLNWEQPQFPTFKGYGDFQEGGQPGPVVGVAGASALQQKKNGGEMIRRADGSYSRRGLWDNIRANRGSGNKPTKQMLEQERKIKNK
jgi:hypothetical protein